MDSIETPAVQALSGSIPILSFDLGIRWPNIIGLYPWPVPRPHQSRSRTPDRNRHTLDIRPELPTIESGIQICGQPQFHPCTGGKSFKIFSVPASAVADNDQGDSLQSIE